MKRIDSFGKPYGRQVHEANVVGARRALRDPFGGGDGRAGGPAETKKTEYYPLEEGAVWTYKAGDAQFTMKVVKKEKLFDVECYRIEMQAEKVKSTEHVAVTDAGVVRVAFEGKKLEPPVLFLKLPHKKDETWEVNSTVVKGDKPASGGAVGTAKPADKETAKPAEKETARPEVRPEVKPEVKPEVIRGKFKSGEDKALKVPAGAYTDLWTSTADDLDANGQKISITYYFAKDVGMVKQVLKVAGQTVVIELNKYEPVKKS